jgi:hypothetical protein
MNRFLQWMRDGVRAFHSVLDEVTDPVVAFPQEMPLFATLAREK